MIAGQDYKPKEDEIDEQADKPEAYLRDALADKQEADMILEQAVKPEFDEIAGQDYKPKFDDIVEQADETPSLDQSFIEERSKLFQGNPQLIKS